MYVLLWFTIAAFAEQNDSSGRSNKIKEMMDKLRTLPAEKYVDDIHEIRDEMEKIMDYKRRVCHGEFSNIILEGLEVKSLPEKERKLCLAKLMKLKATYIDNLFVARIRFLNHQHKNRIKELNISRQKSIEQIEQVIGKKKSR